MVEEASGTQYSMFEERKESAKDHVKEN